MPSFCWSVLELLEDGARTEALMLAVGATSLRGNAIGRGRHAERVPVNKFVVNAMAGWWMISPATVCAGRGARCNHVGSGGTP